MERLLPHCFDITLIMDMDKAFQSEADQLSYCKESIVEHCADYAKQTSAADFKFFVACV